MSDSITITSTEPAKKIGRPPAKKMGRPKGSRNKPKMFILETEEPKVDKSYSISVSETHYKIIEGLSICSGVPRSTILSSMIEKFVNSVVKG